MSVFVIHFQGQPQGVVALGSCLENQAPSPAGTTPAATTTARAAPGTSLWTPTRWHELDLQLFQTANSKFCVFICNHPDRLCILKPKTLCPCRLAACLHKTLVSCTDYSDIIYAVFCNVVKHTVLFIFFTFSCC